MRIETKCSGHLMLLTTTVYLPVDIEVDIEFDTAGRDHCSYYFEDECSQTIYDGNNLLYAAGNPVVHERVVTELEEMLSHYGVTLGSRNRAELLTAVYKSFAKCESTYGNGVRDFDPYCAVIKFRKE